MEILSTNLAAYARQWSVVAIAAETDVFGVSYFIRECCEVVDAVAQL